jgi:hypothetical protein
MAERSNKYHHIWWMKTVWTLWKLKCWTLDQPIGVRLLCPQPNIWRYTAKDPPEIGSKRAFHIGRLFFYCNLTATGRDDIKKIVDLDRMDID